MEDIRYPEQLLDYQPLGKAETWMTIRVLVRYNHRAKAGYVLA